MTTANTDSPHRSKKLVVATVGMFLINLAGAMASDAWLGVSENIVMAIIEWQAYITLAVIGAQGVLDHIQAKNGKSTPNS